MKSLFDTNQPGNHAKQFFPYYIIHMVNSKKNFFWHKPFTTYVVVFKIHYSNRQTFFE